jgi:serine/threonine protein kinase
MVMELCLGGPLIESMDVSNLTEARVAELIRSILRFLAQCHAKGLIFRDVKPGNFLYATKDEGSSLKATDFGLMIQCDTFPPHPYLLLEKEQYGGYNSVCLGFLVQGRMTLMLKP